jgi:hypothetical protein
LVAVLALPQANLLQDWHYQVHCLKASLHIQFESPIFQRDEM